MLKLRLSFALAALAAGGMTTFVTVEPQPAKAAVAGSLACSEVPVFA